MRFCITLTPVVIHACDRSVTEKHSKKERAMLTYNCLRINACVATVRRSENYCIISFRQCLYSNHDPFDYQAVDMTKIP